MSFLFAVLRYSLPLCCMHALLHINYINRPDFTTYSSLYAHVFGLQTAKNRHLCHNDNQKHTHTDRTQNRDKDDAVATSSLPTAAAYVRLVRRGRLRRQQQQPQQQRSNDAAITTHTRAQDPHNGRQPSGIVGVWRRTAMLRKLAYSKCLNRAQRVCVCVDASYATLTMVA